MNTGGASDRFQTHYYRYSFPTFSIRRSGFVCKCDKGTVLLSHFLPITIWAPQ